MKFKFFLILKNEISYYIQFKDFNESKKLTATSNYDVKAGQEELNARKQAILNSEENKNR